MNFILVIKGISEVEYNLVCENLLKQFKAKYNDSPIFCYLPNCDYPEIEIIWFDEQIERDNWKQIIDKVNE